AAGGGIANLGTLTITNSTISDNQAVSASQTARGGGIFSFLGTIDSFFTFTGSVKLARVTLEGNTARGDAVAADTNGVAAEGGGLYLNGGPVTIVDSTIRTNTAQGGNGGVGTAGADGTTPNPLTFPGWDGGHGDDGKD